MWRMCYRQGQGFSGKLTILRFPTARASRYTSHPTFVIANAFSSLATPRKNERKEERRKEERKERKKERKKKKERKREK